MSNIKLKTPKKLNPKRCSPRWALLDGVSVRYTISGEIGRPLLLLHEMGGSLESWDPVLEHLPSNQIIIRCDMRGAGGSEKIRAATTCNALSDDIAALLNYLGVSGANPWMAVTALFAFDVIQTGIHRGLLLWPDHSLGYPPLLT